MNLQTPPVSSPDQFLPPDLPPRQFWHRVFPGLVLLWACGLLVGMRLAASLAVPEAMTAIGLAAFVALSTGWAKGQLALRLSSGQLQIPPWQQFTARLLLGLAKLTATAALLLELARYGLSQIPQADAGSLLPVALLALLGLTAATLPTVRSVQPRPPATRAGWLLPVGLLLLGLIWIGLLRLGELRPVELVGLNQTATSNWGNLLQAAALLSAAYASYEPLMLGPTTSAPVVRLTLKTFTIALGLGWLLFSGVAVLASSGIPPLLLNATALGGGLVHWTMLGAIATLIGGLLILLPQLTEQLLLLNQEVYPPDHRQSPVLTLAGLSLILACLLLVGDLQSLWSFTAFAGLMHAALVQWILLKSAPLRTNRRFPQQAGARLRSGLPLRGPSLRECFQGLRLAVCLLAFWVDWQVWLVSLSLVALGLIWRGMTQWTDGPA